MKKHDFDWCKSDCKECDGINIERLNSEGLYKCLNTDKILTQEDETTLVKKEY